mgnify:CR=1 FL=1
MHGAFTDTTQPPTGEVWPEAIQYTAISFADEKWGGIEKAKAFFAGLGGRSYEAEIFTRLGDIFFDQTKYAAAVAAYKHVLAKDPLAPGAPRLQAKIVQAWSRDRQFEKEQSEREILVASYGEQSAWQSRNKGDPELVKEVRDLSEKSLVRAASRLMRFQPLPNAYSHTLDPYRGYFFL